MVFLGQAAQKASCTAAVAAERLAELDAKLAGALEVNEQLRMESQHASAAASLLAHDNERLRASLPLQYSAITTDTL
jgi:hypothetical protein